MLILSWNSAFYIYIGQKFLINWFEENFIQPTYKIEMCPLNIEEARVFLLMLLKKHVRSTCY
jgi:hypothetical protein